MTAIDAEDFRALARSSPWRWRTVQLVVQYVAAYPSTVTSSAAGDNNKPVYEVRLRASGPNVGVASAYAAADIVVDGATWHLYGQSAPAPKSTSTTVIDPIATLRVLNLSAVSRTERTQLEVRFV